MPLSFKKIKPFIGALLVALAIAALVYWETGGREELVTVEVLVSGTDIAEGRVIAADMLKVSRVLRENVAGDALIPSESGLVVGQIADRSIAANSQISESIVRQRPRFDESLSIFTIEADWIASRSESLRSGDVVDCYTQDGVVLLGSYTVAYVRDAQGREVVTADGGAGRIAAGGGSGEFWERGDATAQVASVEIMCDIEQYRHIYQTVWEQGQRILIVQKR